MLAFYDSIYSGLVPCRVVGVRRVPANQWPPAVVAPGELEFTLKVTAARGAYDKGAVLTAGHRCTVPRDCVRASRQRLGGRYIQPYNWSERLAAAGTEV